MIDYSKINNDLMVNGFVHLNTGEETVNFDVLSEIVAQFKQPLIVSKNHIDGDKRFQIVSEEKMFGGAYLHWHTDQSYSSGDFNGTMLAYGSADHETYTEFADMRLAYDGLSDEDKEKFSKITCVYAVPTEHIGLLSPAQRRILADRANTDAVEGGKEWPLVINHPITQRKSLYYSPFSCRMSNTPFDTKVLLDHCIKYSFKHHWKKGDIILWDNRSVIHRRMAFTGHRELYRVNFRYE